MTGIRTAVQLSGCALLTFLVFHALPLFRHPAILLLVPLLPITLVFVVAPAAKTVFRETISLRTSFTWWEGLWLVLFLSGLVFRVRAAQDIDQSPLDFWAAYRVGLVLIVAFVLCARLVSDQTRWLGALFSGTLGLLTIYTLLSVTSTAWSVRPGWTFYKSIEYFVDLAVISAVVVSVRSTQDYRKFVNWTWTLLGLLVTSAWLGAIFDPADALMSGENLGPLTVRLEGVMPGVDANTIGEICAILALVALNRMLNETDARQNRGWYGGLLSASFVTLILSQTRADFVAFAIGLGVLAMFSRRYLLTAVTGGVFAVSSVAMLKFTNLGRTLTDFFLRGESAQTAQGLSGRMDMWQLSIDAFLRRPWTGYGGFAGSRFVIIPGTAWEASGGSSASNTYLDSLLGLGVAGPLLIVIVVAAAAWFLLQAIRNSQLTSSDRPLAIEMLVVLSVIAVRSLISSNIIGHPPIGFLAVIGFVEVARRQRVRVRPRRMLVSTTS